MSFSTKKGFFRRILKTGRMKTFTNETDFTAYLHANFLVPRNERIKTPYGYRRDYICRKNVRCRFSVTENFYKPRTHRIITSNKHYCVQQRAWNDAITSVKNKDQNRHGEKDTYLSTPKTTTSASVSSSETSTTLKLTSSDANETTELTSEVDKETCFTSFLIKNSAALMQMAIELNLMFAMDGEVKEAFQMGRLGWYITFMSTGNHEWLVATNDKGRTVRTQELKNSDSPQFMVDVRKLCETTLKEMEKPYVLDSTPER